jgi:hypothetical protein
MSMRNGLVALLVLVAGVARAGSPQPSLLDQVPDASLAAGVVRPAALELFRQAFRQSPDMQKDVGAYLARRIGVDLTRVDGVAFWSTQLAPQPTVGAFLKLADGGTHPLKGNKVGSFDGADLVSFGKGTVAASVAGGLVVGDEQEVRVGIAVSHKHAPGLGPQSPLAALTKDAAGADLAAGLAASAVKDAQVQAMAGQYGIKTVSLVMRPDGLILLTAAGDGAKLKTAQQMLAGVMNVILAQAKMKKDQAMNDDKVDFAEGLGAVSGYHTLVSFWNEFNPKIEGDKLVGRYQLPQLKSGPALFMAMMGVGAAVAIPAFTKYVKRSKAAEASANVRRIADAAAAYAAERAGKQKAKFAFPKSTAWTPAKGCCGQPNNTCVPEAGAWKGATWTALGFSVDEPSRFQYRIESSGTGAKAKLFVWAKGDVDCDGTEEQAGRMVSLDPQGNPVVSEPLDR